MENLIDHLEQSFCMVGGHADACQCHITHKPIYPIGSGISHAEWRWFQLEGYMFTGKNCYIWGPEGKKYELTAGISCMNCHSKVYYDKCPNDECYNFYMYTDYKHIKELDHLFWEMLYIQNPHLKEENEE